MPEKRTKHYNRQLFDTSIARTYDRPLEYTPDKFLTAQKQLPTIGYDPQMEVTPFGEPVILANLQTIATSILRLLYTVPGQFPDYPNMGIDIRKYLFSFEDEFTAAKLRQEIMNQIPKLEEYVGEPDNFQVVKTEYEGNPVILILLKSNVRMNNGLETEIRANIGLSFDSLHKLVSDVVFAYDGMNRSLTERFSPKDVKENPMFNIRMKTGG